MELYISNTSTEPIYGQIIRQFKEKILTGKLEEGDALPSIRLLAKELCISVITTKRAYEELEKDGFLYTIPAKGCFVAPKNTELLREENLKKIEDHMEAIAQLALSCNLSKEDLLNMFHFCLEEHP